MNGDAFLEDDDDAESASDKAKRSDDFLLAEYGSITQAYFNTTTAIATFFKNYLIIVGLPIPVFVFLLTQSTRNGALPEIPDNLVFFIPTIGVLIGVLGLFVMIFVVNLRLDALLYARTVNGLRRYFYDRSAIEYPEELQMRVLPRSIHLPRYFEWHYFLPVVAVFALLNAVYPVIGLVWYLHNNSADMTTMIWASADISLICIIIHAAAYRWLTSYRDTSYLRKYIIAVDVDGVLNKHRDYFCTMIWLLFNKSIWANQITYIPVHDCQRLNITLEEELAVFNQPLYWNGLAPMEDAADVLRKLKNVLGYKVYVFTHRPFPEPKQYPPSERSRYENLWALQVLWNSAGLNLLRRVLQFWDPLRHGIIRTLTENWLRRHGFEFDKLFIEAGNVHTTDNKMRDMNRFTMCVRHEVRIFVEDDLFKAIKLANICEIVFLIDHPYNQTENLPRNVIRVFSWQEIYEFIRQKL